ncbi:MAG: DUF3795 domain-containing protein [Anaerolineae bacterium]
MGKSVEMLAACGLDCGPCPIRLIPSDAEAAETAISWFKEMGWLKESEGVPEAVERGMYCKGCRGDRSVHWSPDCEIMLCCVDKKHLEHCGQCAELMSCEKLGTFANDGHAHHREAVERLRRMFGSSS